MINQLCSSYFTLFGYLFFTLMLQLLQAVRQTAHGGLLVVAGMNQEFRFLGQKGLGSCVFFSNVFLFILFSSYPSLPSSNRLISPSELFHGSPDVQQIGMVLLRLSGVWCPACLSFPFLFQPIVLHPLSRFLHRTTAQNIALSFTIS